MRGGRRRRQGWGHGEAGRRCIEAQIAGQSDLIQAPNLKPGLIVQMNEVGQRKNLNRGGGDTWGSRGVGGRNLKARRGGDRVEGGGRGMGSSPAA